MGTEFAGELKKFCNAQEKRIYATISETKGLFAQRTLRW